MVDYKTMYYIMCRAATEAMNCIDRSEIAKASFKLIEGLQLSEQVYVETADPKDDEQF